MIEYAPEIFDVSTMRAAREIILTPEDYSTDERWSKETPYLADLIISSLNITNLDVVLDYGCGIGRLAKELIQKTECRVVGVDASASMRALSASYVGSPRFFTCHPEMLYFLPQFTKVIGIWVFQHILDLPEAIAELSESVAPGGRLALANNIQRAIPTRNGWHSDLLDVSLELEKFFSPETDKIQMDKEFVGAGVSQNTYWRLFRKIGD